MESNNLLLDWSYFCRQKSTEELTESLLLTTMELESARFKAEQELKQKDQELNQLKHLLNTAIIQKNQAQNQYQTLLTQLHRNTTAPPPHSVASSVEDDHVTTAGFSSSDCDESIVSSPPPPPSCFTEDEIRIPVKSLPEKGKFLEAVVKAGPLLHNLLLAGPLPHWRHPPPPLETYQIPPPPVVVPPAVNRMVWKVNNNNKRGVPEGSDSSTEPKYQRLNSDC
ncbi:uncharacterized protein LOC143580977 [Bidens hawaiensis]|uniref:uncharacterized protein LOC143580977 n=1 Tax=Bidens hawaiensis TaxID=980011 RepID=UPI00404B38B1